MPIFPARSFQYILISHGSRLAITQSLSVDYTMALFAFSLRFFVFFSELFANAIAMHLIGFQTKKKTKKRKEKKTKNLCRVARG